MKVRVLPLSISLHSPSPSSSLALPLSLSLSPFFLILALYLLLSPFPYLVFLNYSSNVWKSWRIKKDCQLHLWPNLLRKRGFLSFLFSTCEFLEVIHFPFFPFLVGAAVIFTHLFAILKRTKMYLRGLKSFTSKHFPNIQKSIILTSLHNLGTFYHPTSFDGLLAVGSRDFLSWWCSSLPPSTPTSGFSFSLFLCLSLLLTIPFCAPFTHST